MYDTLTKFTFGEHIKKLREEHGLPIRKVAAFVDIDPSTLSKIERGERSANKEIVPSIAELFKEDEEMLNMILLSDKIAYDLIEESNPSTILEIVLKKIKILKNKNLKQGSLDFEKR
ncbi:Helix-turn-helix [Maribacter dokdonensis]|uniref:Helix-turn-helix n=1 Tax=Maribacter dokdonensis TaxID=320912 RepID=A0A1H4M7N8_9FLAO|nr:helix-turn-helix transcriptional regulator [Maribacter dokdonensis]SEB79059.1 Helix-turn-helix [Maribacter dokdonensis]